MNLCSENGIYLGTRGAAAALQCFLVPLKSPELAKASWAAAQRILITNGSKLLGTVCCFQNAGVWSGRGRSPAMRYFFAPAIQFRPLLVTFCLTSHLHLHMQSNHCLFRLSLSIQSRPVFWKAASVSPRSPNLEPVLVFCAALEPGSLGGGGWWHWSDPPHPHSQQLR